MWPDKRITTLFNIKHPILLAPLAGPGTAELAIAVAEGGGLAALPCAMLSADQIRESVAKIRKSSDLPLNLNFFTHPPPPPDATREKAWKDRLRPYYAEFGLDPNANAPSVSRTPFSESTCALIEELHPSVVSFHFGLPGKNFMQRVKEAGCKIIAFPKASIASHN